MRRGRPRRPWHRLARHHHSVRARSGPGRGHARDLARPRPVMKASGGRAPPRSGSERPGATGPGRLSRAPRSGSSRRDAGDASRRRYDETDLRVTAVMDMFHRGAGILIFSSFRWKPCRRHRVSSRIDDGRYGSPSRHRIYLFDRSTQRFDFEKRARFIPAEKEFAQALDGVV